MIVLFMPYCHSRFEVGVCFKIPTIILEPEVSSVQTSLDTIAKEILDVAAGGCLAVTFSANFPFITKLV